LSYIYNNNIFNINSSNNYGFFSNLNKRYIFANNILNIDFMNNLYIIFSFRKKLDPVEDTKVYIDINRLLLEVFEFDINNIYN
jgi:hypothetical protein